MLWITKTGFTTVYAKHIILKIMLLTHFYTVSMLLGFSDISMAMKRAEKLPFRIENSSTGKKSEEKSLSETQAAYCDVREYIEYRKQAAEVAVD